MVRVLVFGYDELVLSTLDVVSDAGTRIVGVVFPSNRSGENVDIVRSMVAKQGYPILVQPPRQTVVPFITQIQRLKPDLGVVWSYPMILPAELVAAPRFGCVNMHTGLLPYYRGGHALPWAIINGEAQTGVTLHYMDAGIDSGPLVAQAQFPIGDQDDLVSLMQKSKAAGTSLLTRCWAALATGKAARTPQDETQARYYPLLTPEHGKIDWSTSNKAIANLIRALVFPLPGAYSYLHGHQVVIRQAALVAPAPEEQGPPGLVTQVDQSGVRIATGKGQLLVRKVEIHKPPASQATIKNFTISVGDRFGNE